MSLIQVSQVPVHGSAQHQTLDALVVSTSINPSTDAAVSVGTSSLRYTTFAASTAFRVFAASGDANPTSSLESGALKFGAGGASALDMRLARLDANTIVCQNASGSSTQNLRASKIIGGDAVQVGATAFTAGSLGSLICPVKTDAGAFTDALGGNLDGAIGVNTNELKLYGRMGAAWKSVALAGFNIPKNERLCPVCKVKMGVGDKLVMVADKEFKDNDLHAIACHLKCAVKEVS